MKHKRFVKSIFSVAVLVCILLGAVFAGESGALHLDLSARWIDRTTIEVTYNGRSYLAYENNIIQSGFEYVYSQNTRTLGELCEIEIKFSDAPTTTLEANSGDLVRFKHYTEQNGNKFCGDIDSAHDRITIDNGRASLYLFEWVDSGTIHRVDIEENSDEVYLQDSSNSNLYIKANDVANNSECFDSITINPASRSVSEYSIQVLEGGACVEASSTNQVSSSAYSSLENSVIYLANSQASSLPSGTGSNGQGVATGDPDCQAGSWSWLVCGLIDLSISFVDTVRANVIEPFLETTPISTEPGTPLFETWKTIRNISFGLLIPIFLLTIIIQASSLQIVDAYTVKKVLPRLVIAVIGVSLSIYIVAILVDFFNVLGSSIDELFKSIITDNGQFVIDYSDVGDSNAAAAVGVGLISGSAYGLLSGGIFTGSALFTLSVLVPAVLALLLVLFTLVIRQAVLIAMVIVAPLAFLAWVFPGTQRIFKEWYDNFWKILFMYPLIVIFLSAGTLLASMLSESTGAISYIITIIAIVGPLFLIPYSFRFAGRAIGTLATFGQGLNDRSRGFIDTRRNAARQRYDDNVNQFKAGGLYRGGGKNPLNRIGKRVGGGFRGTFTTPGQGRARRDMEQLRKLEVAKAKLDEDPGFAGLRPGDEVFWTAVASKKRTKAEMDKIDKSLHGDSSSDDPDKQLGLYALRRQAEEAGDSARVQELDQKILEKTQAKKRWEDNIAMANNMKSIPGLEQSSTAVRIKGLMNTVSSGFIYSAGDKGVAEIMEDARSIAGSNEAMFMQILNEAQARAVKAGRFDLAGINNASGPDLVRGLEKASDYQIANFGTGEVAEAQGQRIRENIAISRDTSVSADRRLAAQKEAYVMARRLANQRDMGTGHYRSAANKELSSFSMRDITAGVSKSQQEQWEAEAGARRQQPGDFEQGGGLGPGIPGGGGDG